MRNREAFEKLPEIAAHIHNVIFDIGCDKYLPKKMGYVTHEFSAYFLNGAWYAFQEQQKKIDELQARVDAIEKWVNKEKFVPTETWLTEDIVFVDELIDILKGNKDENY